MVKNFKMDPLITDELKHSGVKGMKWGVRKNRDGGSRRGRAKGQSAGEASGAKPKKQSRRERRAEARQALAKAYQDRALEVFAEAEKNPTSLVKVRTESGPWILTGQEFTDYVKNGGAFDVRTVDISEPLKGRQ